VLLFCLLSLSIIFLLVAVSFIRNILAVEGLLKKYSKKRQTWPHEMEKWIAIKWILRSPRAHTWRMDTIRNDNHNYEETETKTNKETIFFFNFCSLSLFKWNDTIKITWRPKNILGEGENVCTRSHEPHTGQNLSMYRTFRIFWIDFQNRAFLFFSDCCSIIFCFPFF